MANFVRHFGLDLPVYDDSLPILSKPEILQAGQIPEDHFVRHVWFGEQVDTGPYRGLLDFLKVADEEFDRIAEHAGTVVVRHEWGLIPLGLVGPEGYLRRLLMHEYVPPAFLLGAQVETIRRIATPRHAEIVAISNGVMKAEADPKRKLQWTDKGAHQFTHGITCTRPQIWQLNDLDLSFCQPSEAVARLMLQLV